MEPLESVLTLLHDDIRRLGDGERTPSRYVGPGATREAVEAAAKSASFTLDRIGKRAYGQSPEGVEFLRSVKAARQGNPDAFRSLKAWNETTDAQGGFMVAPTMLAFYVEQRRASSPLRERCSEFNVGTNEVWVLTEGNAVTVQHLPESGTKPNSTGSVGQKVSTVHKVAGTSTLSDELLEDSNGLAAEIVTRQFAGQIGREIDRGIISGTGIGEPTGIRNATGVASTAVDGQGGAALRNSVVKAMSRISQRFFEPDTVVIHPRDAVKFDLAIATDGTYLFPGGVNNLFGNATVVLDANLPANLGAGNESIMIVGTFKPGAYFFSRHDLRIDTSSDAAFFTDETVYRAVERYGFAVVNPGAFELLTAITP